MATKKRRSNAARPFWERGYRSHGYWQGKKKLGVVRLDTEGAAEEKYRWQAGTHAGSTSSLIEAKRAVESAVLLGTSQLPLFEADPE